jgi:hypothetical protein
MISPKNGREKNDTYRATVGFRKCPLSTFLVSGMQTNVKICFAMTGWDGVDVGFTVLDLRFRVAACGAAYTENKISTLSNRNVQWISLHQQRLD